MGPESFWSYICTFIWYDYIFSTLQMYLKKQFSKKFGQQVFGHVLSNVCDKKYFAKFLWNRLKYNFKCDLKKILASLWTKKAERLHVSTTTTAIWWELPPMIYSLHFFSSEIKKQKLVLDCQKKILPSLTFISFYGSVSVRQLLGIQQINLLCYQQTLYEAIKSMY